MRERVVALAVAVTAAVSVFFVGYSQAESVGLPPLPDDVKMLNGNRADVPSDADVARLVGLLERHEPKVHNRPSELTGISNEEARQVLFDNFQSDLAALNGDPLRLVSGVDVEKVRNDYTAVVNTGHDQPALLSSSMPIFQTGQHIPSLHLESHSQGFSPEDPLVDLTIGHEIGDGVKFPGLDLSPLGLIPLPGQPALVR